MKKSLIIALTLLIAVLFIIPMFGHYVLNTPPSINAVRNQFLSNKDEINVIVEYMIDSGYEDIYISSADGFMLADLVEIKIHDEECGAAIKKLIQGNEYIHIAKNSNTIYFLQWRGLKDIGCGITYSINRTDAPEIQFATELVPLFDDGWFYYMSDYNRWRSE